MNKTKKKFPIFFVIFTLMYLVLEITFRTDLLNVVSTLKDIVDIESIEVVGRFIASIGFVLFIFSNFKLHISKIGKWNILLKTIVYPFICYFAFTSFYTFQEKAITYLAEKMTIEQKKEALLLTLEKDSLYFDKIKMEGYPYTSENKNTSESKIFLALFPFLNNENSYKIKMLEDNKKTLVANSVMGRWSNSENINDMIAKESEILNYIYYGFTNMDENRNRNIFPAGKGIAYQYILANYTNAYAQAAMNYKSEKSVYRENAKANYYLHNKLLSKESFENKLIQSFSKAIISIELGKNKNQYSNANSLEYFTNENFYTDGHEQGTLVPNYKYKYSDMRAFALAKNNMHSLIFSDLYSGFRFNFSNCSANVSSESGVYINGKRIKTENFNNIYNEIFEKENKNNNTINCRYSYESYKKTKQELHNLFTLNNAGFYIDNVNKYEIKPSFVNNNYLFRKVAMYLLEFFVEENTGKNIIEILNYDFEKYERFENELDYSSEKAFVNSIKRFGAKEFTTIFLEKTKQHGLNLSFLKNYKNHRIFYNEFYEINEVKQEIKRVFPFFVNNKNKVIKVNNVETIDERNIELFKKYLIEKEYNDYIKVLNNPNLMNYGQQYYELGNAVAKGYIAPPMVLFISAILIFISIINLLVKIANVYIEDKKGILKYTLFIILFTLPIIIPNNYSGNVNMDFYKENKTLKYYTLIWLQNSERLIGLGSFDNDLVNKYYNELYNFSLQYERSINKDNKSVEIKLNQLKRRD